MTQRPKFVAPRQAPPGIWRRTPPMIFAPICGLLGLALAWQSMADASVLGALSGLLDGAAVALFLFAVLAYLSKVFRRPAVVIEEQETLPGLIGIGAGVLSIGLCAGVLAAYAPMAGRGMLVIGLLALLWLIVTSLRQMAAAEEAIGPERQFLSAGLLVAAAVAPMMGWPGLGRVLIWPGAGLALLLATINLMQLRRHRVPKVLLPLMALHLVPVAAYGMAAVQLGAPFLLVACGLSFVGLLLLPVLALRAGSGLFLSVLTIPLGLSALLFAHLPPAFPGIGILPVLASLVLVAATLTCIPATFLVMRDWARGRLATSSNAAIA